MDHDKNEPVLLCNTLEPQWRDLRNGEAKIMERTAIPEGRYRVILYQSNRWQRRMPYLCDVPYFSHIMIHPGNSSADTKGCILVGEKTQADLLTSSRTHFDRLYHLIEKHYLDLEGITITII